MPTWTGAWSEAEAESYLRDRAIPIRLACRTPAGGLWMLSLWYQYRDGAFRCATGADADIVRYLRDDSGVSFEVSDNEPPYGGVRGAGAATVEPDEDKEQLEELLKRYLGGTDSELAARLLDPGREKVRIRVEPTKLHSWDFSDRMADVRPDDPE